MYTSIRNSSLIHKHRRVGAEGAPQTFAGGGRAPPLPPLHEFWSNNSQQLPTSVISNGHCSCAHINAETARGEGGVGKGTCPHTLHMYIQAIVLTTPILIL